MKRNATTMMNLLNRIAAEGTKPIDPSIFASGMDGHAFLQAAICDGIADVPWIDASTVCAPLVRKWTADRKPDVSLLKSMPPVFSKGYWIEYTLTDADHPYSIGGLFTSEKLPGGGWDSRVYVVGAVPGMPVHLPLGHMASTLDEKGVFTSFSFEYPLRRDHPQFEHNRDSVLASFGPLIAAHSYLTCRNIGLKEMPVDPMRRRRLVKRFGNERKEPTVRYHVLVLKGDNGRPDREFSLNAEPGPKGMMPLHSVKGHFGHYGSEYGTKDLFGRLPGKFWFTSHDRGDAKNGTIKKDYVTAASLADR